MGSDIRGGFDLANKAESTEYDFGLGVKVMMMGNRRNPNDESGTNLNFAGDRDTRAAGGCSSGGNFRVLASDESDSSSFKSWGARMFTASQRQEFERQTVIFKYMAASIPVPPELLIHIGHRYSSYGGKAALDQEPWRCRRTDGKKWRCSKDAAPDQKYCERHSQKTRPSRSRKLVESSASISASNPNHGNNKLVSSQTSSVVCPTNFNIKPSFTDQNSPAMFMSQQYNNSSRYPYWFMKREAQHGQETAHSPSVSPYFGLDQMTSANDFMGNDNNQSAMPRQFLDAWSIGDHKSNGIDKPDSSLLTLSMAGGSVHEENEMANARLGMGLFESEGDTGIGNEWMCSSAPGGPLAEALWADVTESGAVGDSHGLGFMK